MTVRVQPTPSVEYHVHVGSGLRSTLAEDLARAPLGDRHALITDTNVAPTHGTALVAALRDAGLRVDLLTFPAGEEHKSAATVVSLAERLMELGVGRDGAVLALGGGVVGDLAGFVAATYHRGIPYLQLPTTVLAMVDASVGGKTACDLPGGKNLLGAFHQPSGVYADLESLATLPDAELRRGFAEVIKYGLIQDPDLMAFLESSAPLLLRRDPSALQRAVVDSVRIKAAIVSSDARERGVRTILNFGHTVAHALEAVTGYRLSHGEAVAIGMVVEAEISRGAGRLPGACVDRIRRLLASFDLPVAVPGAIGHEDLLDACRRDKKVRGGVVHCVGLEEIGAVSRDRGSWTWAVEPEELRAALSRCSNDE